MHTQENHVFPKLAYSVESLALASDVGRTTIYTAIKVGELEAFHPVVNGKKLKRTIITHENAQKWMARISSAENAA